MHFIYRRAYLNCFKIVLSFAKKHWLPEVILKYINCNISGPRQAKNISEVSFLTNMTITNLLKWFSPTSDVTVTLKSKMAAV